MSDSTTLLPFQSMSMSTAQLAAEPDLARYSGHAHALYAYQLRRWFAWCEVNELDPLAGIQRESHSHNYAKAQSERSAVGVGAGLNATQLGRPTNSPFGQVCGTTPVHFHRHWVIGRAARRLAARWL